MRRQEVRQGVTMRKSGGQSGIYCTFLSFLNRNTEQSKRENFILKKFIQMLITYNRKLK